MIKVAIIEDNSTIRESLETMVNLAPDCQCVGAWGTAEDALRMLRQQAPDVVLMDIQLPRMSGIACTAELKKALPTVPVMMLTVYEDTDAIFNALKAGASGYLLKRSDPAQVLEAVKELHHGGAPMTGEIARKVIDSFHRAKATTGPQDKLTAREEEILEHLAKGFVTKEIADKLGISSATVRFHLRHIYDKLHVHSRVEAVIKYLG